MRIGTLFGGCGGWDIGAWMAGASPVWSVELEPAIAAVQRDFFEKRAPRHRVVVGDVREAIELDLPPIDVLYASPVCKAHSKGTSRLDTSLCEHAWTGTAVPQWVDRYRPKAVVIENVTGYRSHEAFRQIQRGLTLHGYVERSGVFRFNQHGLPQSRERFLSWWTEDKNDIKQLLPEIPGPSWFDSTSDLLRDLPKAELANWQVDRIDRMRQRGVKGPYPWLISSFNASTTRFGEGKTVIVGRFANQPAWTVVESRRAQSGLRVLLEDGSVRAASLRMLARFQGFPDEWEIPEDTVTAYTCIGNAVPPSISALVTRTLMRALS
jgi:DNA (cytosine-5)-methyltransferase 1